MLDVDCMVLYLVVNSIQMSPNILQIVLLRVENLNQYKLYILSFIMYLTFILQTLD